LKGHFPKADFSFYRTSHGAEMDIVMRYMNKVYAIECKVTNHPKLSRGAWNAIKDIKADYTFIVAPVKESWPVREGVDVVTMDDLFERITKLIKKKASIMLQAIPTLISRLPTTQSHRMAY
jgi:hypothetical protein